MMNTRVLFLISQVPALDDQVRGLIPKLRPDFAPVSVNEMLMSDAPLAWHNDRQYDLILVPFHPRTRTTKCEQALVHTQFLIPLRKDLPIIATCFLASVSLEMPEAQRIFSERMMFFGPIETISGQTQPGLHFRAKVREQIGAHKSAYPPYDVTEEGAGFRRPAQAKPAASNVVFLGAAGRQGPR